MRKVALCFAAALALLSCSKKGQVPGAPTITWDANRGFDVMEIGDQMDGTIQVKASTGISALQIKCTQMPDLCKIIASQWIGIQAYKSSYTLDVVSDAKAASVLAANGIATPAGENLIDAPTCTLDMKALLEALSKDLALENGTRFSFDIIASSSDKSTTKTAAFRWTSGPTFPDDPALLPTRYGLHPDDTRSFTLDVTIPGKLEACTLSFGGAKADEGILAYIKKKSASKGTVIDLVNDTNVKQAFDMDKLVKGAAQITLNFSGLFQDLGYEVGTLTSTEMLITVKDALGKESTHTIALYKD